MAKSNDAGANTTDAEVTSISRHGFWLYLGGRELFVDFREFPWFADASLKSVTNVRWSPPDQLHWPDLDIDLSVESIELSRKVSAVLRSVVAKKRCLTLQQWLGGRAASCFAVVRVNSLSFGDGAAQLSAKSVSRLG